MSRPLFLTFAILLTHTCVFLCSPIKKHEEKKNAESFLEEPDIEAQLESLKKQEGDSDSHSVSLTKSQSSGYTNLNGQKEEYSNFNEQVKDNNNLLAAISQQMNGIQAGNADHPEILTKTEVDIPAKGIHRTFINNNDKESVSNRGMPDESSENSEITEDYYMPYSGIQYTPRNMAEYVFWTGDEKGVTLAIEELLEEGLMTREKAIAYLKEIKYNLEYLQAQYGDRPLFERKQMNGQQMPLDILYPSNNAELQLQEATEKKSLTTNNEANKKNVDDRADSQSKSQNGEIDKTKDDDNVGEDDDEDDDDDDDDDHVEDDGKVTAGKKEMIDGQPLLSEEDYEELLERLRVADYLYTEYSLEEVIYQLAKVMFSQSLSKGSAEAQEALQKFTAFLEEDARQGRISKELEKKVLDVLMVSLMDSLSEHPEMVVMGQGPVIPGSEILKQLSENKQAKPNEKPDAESQQSTLLKGQTQKENLKSNSS